MFIKLTTKNGSEVWLNSDRIESFGVITEGSFKCKEDCYGLTYICEDEGMDYVVRESPENIYQELSSDGVRLTPIKPIERKDRFPSGQYDCPICGCSVGWYKVGGQRHFNETDYNGHIKMHYCPMCGQKLDWEGIK